MNTLSQKLSLRIEKTKRYSKDKNVMFQMPRRPFEIVPESALFKGEYRCESCNGIFDYERKKPKICEVCERLDE